MCERARNEQATFLVFLALGLIVLQVDSRSYGDNVPSEPVRLPFVHADAAPVHVCVTDMDSDPVRMRITDVDSVPARVSVGDADTRPARTPVVVRAAETNTLPPVPRRIIAPPQ